MSKLYLKQKVFSWKDRFTVKNEYGEDVYTVEGEFFSWGKKLHVYDMTGTEVSFIREKVWSFLPKYHVFIQGIQVAEIVKDFTFLRPHYSIHGPEWECQGSFWEHDYSITEGSRSVVRVSKAWFSWGDSYELAISDPRDELLALSIVLAIDAVLAKQEAAAASSTTSSAN